jgi:hypothetical protein
LKEAPNSSETSVLTRATWRNIPEDAILHSHLRENLKSYQNERDCCKVLNVYWKIILKFLLENKKVEEDEVGRTCGTNGEKRNVYRLLIGKPEGKRPLGRSRLDG